MSMFKDTVSLNQLRNLLVNDDNLNRSLVLNNHIEFTKAQQTFLSNSFLFFKHLTTVY